MKRGKLPAKIRMSTRHPALETDEADQLGVGEVVEVIDGGAEDFGFGEFLDAGKRLIVVSGGGVCRADGRMAESNHRDGKRGRDGGQARERDGSEETLPPRAGGPGKAGRTSGVGGEVWSGNPRGGLVKQLPNGVRLPRVVGRKRMAVHGVGGYYG